MIIKQKMIYRQDLKSNPDVLYVFGDNTIRKGMGGQAGQMRGEPNAVGVATKLLPSQTDNSYFSDNDYTNNVKTLMNDLQPVINHLKRGGIVVWPSDGIGTGLSELPQRAPKTWKALCQLEEYLASI
jgi:hypothetical protein